MEGQFIAYYRVSTQKQNLSHLGLEAQQRMCVDFARSKGCEIVKEFCDVESGKSRTRAELWRAIEYAKANNVPLVIAKLDRLARDVEFTFKVINTGIDIHFCDMPVVNTMVLGVFAAVAQYERELISQRTKQALAAKKARGETWARNTDTSAAVQASAKAMTDRAIHYAFEGDLPKYCKARYEQGWGFMDILSDAQKMYDIDPIRYGTRKGCRLNKAQLHRWMCIWRDIGRAAVPDNDRRAGVQRG